ncbi:N-(5'-phosphoribosyl)anthranilate isomerase [compost metagenome]
MIRVKICGLTQEADVRAACGAGADAVGFVMVPGTKRDVSPERVRELVRVAHPFVLTVGVLRDRSLEEAIALVDLTGLRALQLHGSESPEDALALKRARPGLAVFKALQLHAPSDLDGLAAWQGLDGLLLDSGAGSGKPFDWDWLAEAAWPPMPRIVAGGLSAANVGDLLSRITVEAVDVSSGVERGPGVKDAEMVRAFIEAVKRHPGFVAGKGGV